MKLLIITQKVDLDDPILGFFHRWIEEFAKHYEKLTVICLQKGEYNLPNNVKVLSLGKPAQGWSASGGEKLFDKLRAVFKFYKYIWQERKNYDAIFVHMNQEYVLLGGLFWFLLGKKVFMWRNHHAGNFLTDISAMFCDKVFCTSRFSYTAKYKTTVLMPVGVDTDLFKINDQVIKIKNSILFLGRISPSKNVHIFIEALGILKKKGVNFTVNIYGDALPKNAVYFERLKLRARELDLDNILKFQAGIPNYQTPEVYTAHELYVNLSPSGMYDKTIFEAMACGCLSLASNDNLRGQIDERLVINKREAEEVKECLAKVLSLPAEEKKKMIQGEMVFANSNSLLILFDKLYSMLS